MNEPTEAQQRVLDYVKKTIEEVAQRTVFDGTRAPSKYRVHALMYKLKAWVSVTIGLYMDRRRGLIEAFTIPRLTRDGLSVSIIPKRPAEHITFNVGMWNNEEEEPSQ